MPPDEDERPTAKVLTTPDLPFRPIVFNPGAKVGSRFSILRRLGGGGSGTVYAARDILLEEDVALKALRAPLADLEALQRLRDEVRAARRIGHPNVCRVHDLYEADGVLYLVMEILPGDTLRQRLRSGQPSTAEALEILRQLGAGLGAAHRAGVVHCDVKPENAVLVGSRVVLTDFGIARLVGSSRGTRELEGTPAYMSPEQVAGEELDERTDIYALATTACELLLGAHPFVRGTETSFAALADRIAADDPSLPDSSVLEPPRHAALMAALRKGLAKRPSSRFETIDALVSAIVTAVGVGAAPGPATPPRELAGGVRRVATVVHAQVEEREGTDEERAAVRIEAVLDAAAAAVSDADGAVVSRLPRAMVAVFGALLSTGDEPQRAADAARAVAAATSDDVIVKLALDTGRVLVRTVSGVLSVTGEPLARVASLAAAGAPGEVHASRRTARHLARRFEIDAVGPSAVRVGPRRPVEAARILPFVGRESELEHVTEEVLAAARSGRPRSVLVIGPAGIGKSRLRREVVDMARSRMSFCVAEAAATPDAALSPWSVLRGQLRTILDVSEHPSAAEIAAAVRRLIPDDPDGSLAAALEGLVAGRAETPGLVAAAARAALLASARTRPLLLVVDDAHWADRASLEMYQSLSHLEAPIALVCTARPDLVVRKGTFAHTVALGPLSVETAQSLAATCLGRTASAESVRALAEAGEGNPFYIEELAGELIERGDEGGQLPSTVEDAIQARLDRIPPAARAALRAASVLGRTFRRADLARLLGADPDAQLGELEGRRLVSALPPDTSADDRYAIRHALIRDVAYRELGPAARRALHAAAVRVLRERGTEDLTEDRTTDNLARATELARHLEGAEDHAAAVAAYRSGGELALSIGAPADAFHCFSRAAEMAEPEPELLLGLGLAALESGQPAEAERALDAAIARTEGDPAQARVAARALHARAEREKQRAAWHAAVELLRRGLRCVGEDQVLAALLHGSLGWVLGYSLGDTAAGLAEARLAVELLAGTSHMAELARAYSMLGAAYMRVGRWHDQLRCNRKNLELGERLRSIDLRARAHLNLGVNLQSLGELEESIAHSRTALELYTRMCAPVNVGLCRNNLGFALVDLGSLDEAEGELAEAARLSELAGGLYYHLECDISRARLLAKRGDLARARELASAAAERSRGTLIDEGMSRRVLGAILSLAGEHEAAQRELDAAEKSVGGGDVGEEARVVAERARAALRRGDRAEAERLFPEARKRLEALGAKHDLAHLENLDWL